MPLRPLLLLPLLALLFAAPAAGGPDTLDFTGRLGAIAPENILTEPGYYVWCGTGIRGEDGRYYLFYSRWKTGSAGQKHTLANLERPQLLFDESGQPVCLLAAAGEKNPFQGTPSFNLHFSIRPETPGRQ